MSDDENEEIAKRLYGADASSDSPLWAMLEDDERAEYRRLARQVAEPDSRGKTMSERTFVEWERLNAEPRIAAVAAILQDLAQEGAFRLGEILTFPAARIVAAIDTVDPARAALVALVEACKPQELSHFCAAPSLVLWEAARDALGGEA